MYIEFHNLATTITFTYLFVIIVAAAGLVVLSIIAFLSSSRKYWKMKAERYKEFIEKKLNGKIN